MIEIFLFLLKTDTLLVVVLDMIIGIIVSSALVVMCIEVHYLYVMYSTKPTNCCSECGSCETSSCVMEVAP